jgi:site-specific DNA-methyltransferase (adenine-specific)
MENLQKTFNKRAYINDLMSKMEVDKFNFGEVMTPFDLVEEMLNLLPNKIWENPNLKWFDPCGGVGNFQVIIVERLMEGLKGFILNEEDRYRHILENMIYVCEIQEKNTSVFLNIFNPNKLLNLNCYNGDFLSEDFDSFMNNVWGLEKFDVLIMNSPYQISSNGNHHRSRPLYHLFIEKGLRISDKLVSVNPSRWMTKSMGLEEFRKNMLSRNDIKFIKNLNFKNKHSIFGESVEIRGGIHFFLIDKEYEGMVNYDGVLCNLGDFDIFLDQKFHEIVKKYCINKKSLSNICESNSLFMNFNNSKLSNEPSEGYVKCYVSNQKGGIKYIKEEDIAKKGKKLIESWKVFTPFASGYGVKFNYFGSKIIGKPREVCSNTFLTLVVNSEQEAESLASYMNTSFCCFFLSLRKKTQNMNKKTLQWIPLVPLDRQWTDEDLFEYFKLSSEEVDLILKK